MWILPSGAHTIEFMLLHKLELYFTDNIHYIIDSQHIDDGGVEERWRRGGCTNKTKQTNKTSKIVSWIEYEIAMKGHWPKPCVRFSLCRDHSIQYVPSFPVDPALPFCCFFYIAHRPWRCGRTMDVLLIPITARSRTRLIATNLSSHRSNY